MSIIIYGASDDLIEVDGDVTEEFTWSYDSGRAFVALSNGCVFNVDYDGCWRITPHAIADGVEWSKVEAVGEDDNNYSDRVTVVGDIRWVVHGPDFAGVCGRATT